MIKEFEFYHGAVFARLFNRTTREIAVFSYASGSNAAYVIKGDRNTAGLYIKHCAKRLTPWRFTFHTDHQIEIEKMYKEYGEVFLALVCEDDGVALLSHTEMKTLLDHNYEPTEWISVARGKRQMYTLKGRDGKLDFKVGASDFPAKVLEYILTPAVILSADELQNDLSLHSLAQSV